MKIWSYVLGAFHSHPQDGLTVKSDGLPFSHLAAAIEDLLGNGLEKKTVRSVEEKNGEIS